MYANMENNHLGYCTIDVPSVTVRLTILCPMFRDVFSYILARLTDVGIHLVIMVGHCHVSVPCSTLCVQLCTVTACRHLRTARVRLPMMANACNFVFDYTISAAQTVTACRHLRTARVRLPMMAKACVRVRLSQV